MPKWSDFVSWIFFGLLAYYGNSLTTSGNKISESVQELNIKMAVMVEHDQVQAREIEKLDTRVGDLEKKRVR